MTSLLRVGAQGAWLGSRPGNVSRLHCDCALCSRAPHRRAHCKALHAKRDCLEATHLASAARPAALPRTRAAASPRPSASQLPPGLMHLAQQGWLGAWHPAPLQRVPAAPFLPRAAAHAALLELRRCLELGVVLPPAQVPAARCRQRRISCEVCCLDEMLDNASTWRKRDTGRTSTVLTLGMSCMCASLESIRLAVPERFQ